MALNLIKRNRILKFQDLARAEANTPRVTVPAGPPWQLWLPDVSPFIAPPNSGAVVEGLVARASQTLGEILTPDSGTSPIDKANQPLSSRAVVMVGMHPRTDAAGVRGAGALDPDFDLTLVAITAGDGSTPGSASVHRVRPSTSTWQALTFSGTNAPLADREALYDYAIMPEGIPGTVDNPIMVFTNGVDDVMMFPSGNAGGANEHAYAELPTGAGGRIRAETVETFNGRLYFGNVTVGGNRFRQMIRRTGPFNGSLDNTIAGSGSFEIREFSRDLLRLEKLGNVLAAYFEDGVAFIRGTDVGTAPDAIEIIRDRRGLVSKFAVTPIGDQAHFGIFDDGWWILDASGRWTEVGITQANGVQVHKWKTTFYSKLEDRNRSRLAVEYDGEFVRITVPVKGETENSEVWIYDPRSDRLSVEKYSVTAWGIADQTIQSAFTWSGTSGTWSSRIGSWASLGVIFGFKALFHGDQRGWVLAHNEDLATKFNTLTQIDENPTFIWKSHLSSGNDPRTTKQVDWARVEYMNLGGSNLGIRVFSNPTLGTESGSVSLSPAGTNPGDILLARHSFHYSAPRVGIELSGQGPVMLRFFSIDLIDRPVEERT